MTDFLRTLAEQTARDMVPLRAFLPMPLPAALAPDGPPAIDDEDEILDCADDTRYWLYVSKGDREAP